MSVTGISTAPSALYQLTQSNAASSFQQVQGEFQKLGQDLTAGNLRQAQSDFATLSQSFSARQQNASSPIAQALSQLQQDLQSGNSNISAAQQDYSKVQQDLRQNPLQRHHHHHPAAPGTQSSGAISAQDNTLTEVLQQLGQDLQANNLSAAQQAYAALQQNIQQVAAASESSLPSLSSASLFSQNA